MAKQDLNKYFESYMKKTPIFVNKKALQSNFIPNNILHREEQIHAVASILAPTLRMEKPSNLFCYGKTGTGKSLTITNVTNEIAKVAEKNNLPVKILYLNCKLKRIVDTEYRLVAQLTREFGEEVPATGLPTQEIYKIFINALDQKKVLLIIILDEIDQLVNKIGSDILYNLTRLNTELINSEISLIGISNDLVFTDNLDPRVRSSLSEEELVFPPYNALQLQSILKERAEIAFNKEAIDSGVLEKCAAYAAREHGDARRALELLRVAGELAERKNHNKIGIDFIDEAEEKIEKDKILDIVSTHPKQHKLTLFSIFDVCMKSKGRVFTGEIYDIYKDHCFKTGNKPLTQRRVSDIIAELDMLGIINAKVISKGRYGRTREIKIAVPDSTIGQINNTLKEGLGL